MSHRKQFVKTFDRASRADYRAQRDKLRSFPPSEIVEDSDGSVEEMLRHLDRVETRKARPERRPQPSELGNHAKLPEGRVSGLRRRTFGEDD